MPTAVNARTDIIAAIRTAGANTGADFGFLMKVAAKESSFNPAAQAKSSSAAGLFQFIDQTWLGAVKKYGPEHGLGVESALIERHGDRYTVADPSQEQAILDLRYDPEAAATIAGAWAQDNASSLERMIGRAVGAADLYAAHFMGLGGAAKLLTAPSNASAKDLFPAAAKANPAIFMDGNAPRTVGEVITRLARGFSDAETPAVETVRPETAAHTNAHHHNFLHRGFSSVTTFLSPLALAALQALDPTRHTDGRRRF